jgi:hypothetical protein
MTEQRPTPAGSFWQTVPGILTAIAAVLTAVAALVGVLASNGLIGSRAKAPGAAAPAASSDNASAGTTISARGTPDEPRAAAGASTPVASGSSQDCVVNYVRQWPDVSVVSMQVGSRDIRFPLSRTMAIRLQDDDSLLGVMVVNPRPDGSFKVLAIRDPYCQAAGYFGNTSGGSAEYLQNWDTISGIIGKSTYEIRLGQTGNELEISRFVKLG